MLAHLAALLLPLALAAPVKRSTGQLIVADDALCLTIGDVTPANGIKVYSVPCIHGSLWDINRGSGSIILHGTNFALDAGSTPGDNGLLKIWQSYPGLYQQTWYYTDDNRIAINGGDQCLDEGVSNGIQTYQCTTGNTNQVFTVEDSEYPTTTVTISTPITTSTPAPSATPSDIAPYIPKGTVYPDTVIDGHRIHPAGRSDLCLTVQHGVVEQGASVGISACFSADDQYVSRQSWDIGIGERGAVTLGASNGLCLDAGDNPSDASSLKIWKCYPGLLQQTWTVSSDGTLALDNGQCLDVQSGSTPNSNQPYGQDLAVQTWACSSNGDPYQKFQIGGM